MSFKFFLIPALLLAAPAIASTPSLTTFGWVNYKCSYTEGKNHIDLLILDAPYLNAARTTKHNCHAVVLSNDGSTSATAASVYACAWYTDSDDQNYIDIAFEADSKHMKYFMVDRAKLSGSQLVVETRGENGTTVKSETPATCSHTKVSL